MNLNLKHLHRAGMISACLVLCIAILFGCTPGKSGETVTTPPDENTSPSPNTPEEGPLTRDISVYPVPKSIETGDIQLAAALITTDSSGEPYKTALENAGFSLGDGGLGIKFVSNNALPSEGYKLSVTKEGITLSSSDKRGAMNGIATLGQLLRDGTLPEVEISDSPDVTFRGVIEGFYGVAWTHEFRLELLKFMGRYKMNTYIYAPKDDPKHRSQWRSTYTGKELEKMKELATTAAENNVRFVYAISPGLDIKLNSGYENDKASLFAKCESLYELGVRDFAILLDDIPTLNAQGHAMLLNDFQTEFCETHEGVSNLTAINPNSAARCSRVILTNWLPFSTKR